MSDLGQRAAEDIKEKVKRRKKRRNYDKFTSYRVGEDGGNEMKRVKQSFRLSEKQASLCLLIFPQTQCSEPSVEGSESLGLF